MTNPTPERASLPTPEQIQAMVESLGRLATAMTEMAAAICADVERIRFPLRSMPIPTDGERAALERYREVLPPEQAFIPSTVWAAMTAKVAREAPGSPE